MSISQKRAPKVVDPNLNRIITKLYDDINEIINAVNNNNSSLQNESYTGKTGNIKLQRKDDGTYELQGKTNEGWVAVNMTLRNSE
mgnify:CR=1 FL=1|tara:strand:- start:149 stop:403 length:255 start_codon:yes stop_codon:yes gene_type:complete